MLVATDRIIQYNRAQIPKTEVVQALKTIWGNRAMIETLAIAINIFYAKVSFSIDSKKTFFVKYKMNLTTNLLIKYTLDCKICHGHGHMLPRCSFKSICPI